MKIFPFVIRWEQQVRQADGYGDSEHVGYRRLENTVYIVAPTAELALRALQDKWSPESYRFEIVGTLPPLDVHIFVTHEDKVISQPKSDGARIIHDTRRL